MREQGLVVAIFDRDLGATLTADVSAGAVALPVSDLAYFSPIGGLLTLRGYGVTETEVAYEGTDIDAGTITGVTPLVNAYTADDTTVNVYPTVTVRYAEVRIDGQNDTVRARVPLALWDRLVPSTLSDSTGEGMRVEVELLSEYVVHDIIGTEPNYGAATFTVEENLRVEGILELTDDATMAMDPGTSATLEGQIAPPTVAPGVTFDYDTVQSALGPSDVGDGAAYYNTRRGAYYDAAGTGDIFYCANGTGRLIIHQCDIAGTFDAEILNDSTYEDGSITKLGSDWYVLAERSVGVGDWYVRKYNSSWVFQSEFPHTYGYHTRPVIANDGTDLWVCWTDGDNRAHAVRYNTTGTDLEEWRGSTAWTTSQEMRGAQVNQSFDFGSTMFVFAYNDGIGLKHFTDTGSALNHDFEGNVLSPMTSHVAGLLWDGTYFYVMGDGGVNSGGSFSKLVRLSGLWWPTGETSVFHVGYTWYDSDGTTHETTISPLQQVNAGRRKRMTVEIPGGIPDEGNADDPDSVRIYLDRKATSPSNAELVRQATLSPGVTSWVNMADITETGTAPPTTNDFPGSNAAFIQSQEQGTDVASTGTGFGWELTGDGTTDGFADLQVFTTTGGNTWYKPKSGGLTTVEVIAIGGGGGGGSGRRNTAGNAAGGGGGGAGACVSISTWPISAFNDSESIVVGHGGAGGAARTTNINGATGSAGADSTMTVGGVVKITAKGANGGSGGQDGSGPWTGGGALPGLSTFREWAGSPGGDGGTNANQTAGDNLPRIVGSWYREGCPGGGGAGGVTAAGSPAAGMDGGDAADLAGGTGAGTGGAAGGAGSSKGANLPFPGAGGGGGGGRAGTGAAGNGGAGGLYGGGGGGGGGGQTVDSGAGGDGAQGIVVVRCY